MWGDSREEVIAFMVVAGIGRPEATEFVDGVVSERAQSIRGSGLRRICIGIPLICLPVIVWFSISSMSSIRARGFGVTILIGLYGIWSLVTGLMMLIAPKTEPGDVAEK
jgi:hypothetical protein